MQEHRQPARGLSQLLTLATAQRRRQLAGELSQLLTPAQHLLIQFYLLLIMKRMDLDSVTGPELQEEMALLKRRFALTLPSTFQPGMATVKS